MDRRPDGARPRPELGRDDLDLVDRRRQDAPPDLGSDARQKQVGGSRDPATDDDPIRRDHDDHVGDPDPEIAGDPPEPLERGRFTGPCPVDGLLGGPRPARFGDPVGPGERLEAAVVAAVAGRTVGVDRLVADLAGRSVMTLVHLAVDRDHAADPGSERQPDHRRRAPAGAQPELREAERPGIVDQGHRDAERGRQRTRHGMTVPRTRHVHEEAGRAGPRVVQPRDADAGARDAPPAFDRRPTDLAELRDDRVGTTGPRRHLATVDDPPGLAVPLDDRPLEVRPPEIEPEVAGRAAISRRAIACRAVLRGARHRLTSHGPATVRAGVGRHRVRRRPRRGCTPRRPPR